MVLFSDGVEEHDRMMFSINTENQDLELPQIIFWISASLGNFVMWVEGDKAHI